MSIARHPFNATVARAAGGNPALAQDLRATFVEGARRHADMLARSRCDANWRISAWRLKGLSATFGVDDLVELAQEAASGAPGDPAIVRRIRQRIATL